MSDLEDRALELAKVLAVQGYKSDHRPKRGWWAPGDYIHVCSKCGGKFIGDKRAAWCADCAYAVGEGQ